MSDRLPGFGSSSATSLRSLRPLQLKGCVLILLGALALSGIACAQTNPESQSRAWDLSVWAAVATGEEHSNSFSEAQIFSAGVFVGHPLTREIGRGWRRGSFEFGADFVPVFMQLAPQKITGTAFDPVLVRWNSNRGHVTPFAEVGGGGLHTRVNFPQGNTSNFNFLARAGGGVLISTRRAQALEISCHWWHVSNANLGTQNPEFNGIQVGLGWHWFK